MMNQDSLIVIRGFLSCILIPLAREALNTLSSGQELKVVTNDKGSVSDFDAFCQRTDFKLVSTMKHGDDYIFWIKK